MAPAREDGNTSSMATLVNTATDLLMSSLSRSTQRLYRKALQNFHSFNVMKLHDENSLPTKTQNIMLYIAEMVNQGYAPSTIASNLSAISFFHKMLSFHDPTSHFAIKKIMVGTNKLHRSIDTRIPITLEILHSLIDSIPHVTQSLYESCLFRSMYILMFNAFLRIGEVTNSQNNLQFHDVSVSKSGIVIKFSKFKHHLGPPILVNILPTGNKYCPVQILSSYLQLRGSVQGPFFCTPSLDPIQPTQFSSILSKTVSFNRLDQHNLKPHSFRIGAATLAAILGYSDSQIQAMGRWKSSAFKKYIRIKSFQIPV